jgi:hypothetical protein
MKTDDLVTMLATGVDAVDPRAAVRRYAGAVGAGVMAAAGLMAVLLGVNPHLLQDVSVPMGWAKFAFVAALLMSALRATLRLARPGASLAGMPAALAAPVLGMWLLAAMALVGTDRTRWPELVLGQTAATCPFLIALLATPVFLGGLWALRGLAPTRLRLAGASVGLLAGAAGACVYAIHCPELAASFLGTWYVLGIAIPTVLGALLGPRLLRW